MPWSEPSIDRIPVGDPAQSCYCQHGKGSAHPATYQIVRYHTNAAGVRADKPDVVYACTNSACARSHLEKVPPFWNPTTDPGDAP